jgi:NTE family protein
MNEQHMERGMIWERRPEEYQVGLALGGGAARGAAHIGVLQVLEEHGIFPDFIAGASVGALVGGLYAAGLSAARQQTLLSEINWKHLVSVRLPSVNLSSLSLSQAGLSVLSSVMGIFDLDKLVDWFDGLVGKQVSFSELNIPFAAIATDVMTGDGIVLNEGLVAPAVRASCSVPVLFTPVRRNGRLLVDGAISNNLPIGVVREMGAEYVIAVDLLPQSGVTLFSRAAPEAREPNNIVDMALHSIYGLVRKTQFDAIPPNCLITPQIGHISFTDLHSADRLYAAGKAAAEAALPKILDDLHRSETTLQ